MAVAKEKLYYKIGEACKILDIQPYVLRYWETEFPILSPSKSKSGQRVYGEVDFALIRRIKELLYDEGFTIAGAKKKLEAEIADGGPKQSKPQESTPGPTAAPKRAAAKKGKASKAKAKSAASEASAAESKELKKLRTGIDKALSEARGILDYLDR